MEDFSEEIDMDNLASIDDFIRELEAKEKDLQIYSETVVEIEESEYNPQIIESFLEEQSPIEEVVAIEPIVLNDFYVEQKQAQQEREQPEQSPKIEERESYSEEINLLNEKIARMETERTELFELSRRRQTDFDNYKKRTERDKFETFNNHISSLALGILPVLDNLGRAIDSAANLKSEKTSDFQQFFNGIALVGKQLNEVLTEMKVKPIIAVGEPFDPHFHEAVVTEESDSYPSNTVIEELLRGYALGEKVIRPAMVKVSVSSNSNTEKTLSEAN